MAATLISFIRAGTVLLVAATAASCAPQPTPEELRSQFAEAERLCLDGQFEKAKTLLKDYLLHDPEHAGAHYYLGRTFMLSKDFRPALAEGEFQTALRLFIRHGRLKPIERFSAEYFEMMCYLDSARVIYLQCAAGFVSGVSPQVLREPILRALDYIEKARAVMPKAPEVDQIGQPIRDLAHELGLHTP